ncbi:MAG TPA: aromatic-ring-hydroxylating dioxygenase subunit beta [Steroidobacter sp.]|jgi:benzoate/toluate 1,2-dioxygenase subunit beta|nr:aromatic-ring-hydroxylating dioxygenase subunit beta [Steroidobacter sp.]
MTTERSRVEEFLYHEASLADSHAYDEWLSLWDRDAVYWVPCNDDDADPRTHVALIYERFRDLEDRIERLKSGYAHAQEPRSRLSRVVSNVLVSPVGEEGLIEVRSVCNITAFRRGQIDIFSGRVIHRLRPAADSFRIAAKTVYLVNNDGVIRNLTFLV